MTKADKDFLLSPLGMDDPSITEGEGSTRLIRAKRLNVAIPLQMSHKGSPIHGYAEALNLSWSGMLVATNFPADENDEFVIEFTLPNLHTPMSIRAKAVRIEQGHGPHDPTMMALAFKNPHPKVAKMISDFVLENLDHR
ncbi:MAG: PilZ domain-containing protein [Bdellovibrionales bacterium]|nr:PilZ domain-containing protein [Bdellovibrionales bacterium]